VGAPQFATGAVLSSVLLFHDVPLRVPTGIKFFNWIGTMWGPSWTFRYADAVLVPSRITVLLVVRTGGCWPPALTSHVTAAISGSRTSLRAVLDHVFATFAGPTSGCWKMTGIAARRAPGQAAFLVDVQPFAPTFLSQHWLGDIVMPRRYADYLPPTIPSLHVVSHDRAFILAGDDSVLWTVFKSWR